MISIKMPIKVHVKGKRRAPLPPVNLNLYDSKIESNNVEEKKQTSDRISQNVSCSDAQKRKKPTPLPPIQDIDLLANGNATATATAAKINNLSEVSKKTHDFTTSVNNNLNILGMNINIEKEKNHDGVDVNFNKAAHDNGIFRNRNDEIWICNNCTLQNPFWKIVCDACEQIKPYNTPNITSANLFHTNQNNDDDNNNLLNSVRMRTKTNVKVDRALLRSSMQPNVHYHTSNQLKNEEKIMNRRISLCVPDMNNDKSALEMEKDRIRSVIRSLNNRALAQKHLHSSNVNNVKSNKPFKQYDDNKNHLNAKQSTSQNKLLQKYDANIDYNFPVKDFHNNYLVLQTDDSKAKFDLLNINKNLDRPNKTDEYYEFIGEMKNYCDQMSLENALKKLDFDAYDGEKSDTITLNSSLHEQHTDEYKMSINLYINFNNAIKVKVKHSMTLNQFKNYISKSLTPCKNPKIYFNGLLLKNDEQTLTNYGIKNQSSLYINSENVVAHTRNVKPIEKKSITVQTEKQPKQVDALHLQKNVTGTETEQKIDANVPCEQFLIEHVQLNRFTIEKFHPKNENITKTKYRGVYNYNPRCNPNISNVLNTKSVSTPIHHIVKNDEKSIEPVSQYIELLSLDDSLDLTKNSDAFECSICFLDYKPLEGVILRNCLHTFCKDCVQNTIIHSDDAEVKCPYIDNVYSCEYLLQDREIKALLSKTEYDEHLAKSLRIAEHQIENSFHCRTPNCKGWCIYEDDVNTFKCPICHLVNCLTCRVIHDGLDCKQYQNMMKNNVDKNPENARTLAMLDEMIQKGEAMNCPACRVILMKKWGCDWLKCSMCKTEICWITRNYRWGPAGKGDTSAGCKCGVDGFKCHPKCNYCH